MAAIALLSVLTLVAMVLHLVSTGDAGARPGELRPAVVVGWLIVTAGTALAVLVWFGRDEPLRTAESAFASVAFGMLIAAPGIIALVGVRVGRPGMLMPAALALVPLSFISFALVTLPLLIPAFLLARTVIRATPVGLWVRAWLAGLVGGGLLFGALACYIGLTTVRTYEHADGMGGGSTSGWVPWETSTLIISLIAAALATSHALAGAPGGSGQRPVPARSTEVG